MKFSRTSPLLESTALESLTRRLEDLASDPDNGSQSSFDEARRLKLDLFSACQTSPALHGYRRRGMTAFRTILQAWRHRRAAEQGSNLEVKTRVILAIEAAAVSGTPLGFLDKVQQIRDLYIKTGSAGADNQRLGLEFRAAMTKFWTAVHAARDARKRT